MGRRRLAAALFTAALVAAACSPAGPAPDGASPDGDAFDPWPAGTYPAVSFADVEADLARRIDSLGLGGASLVVVQDGGVLLDASSGDLDASTVVPIGEAARWLTAVVVATLVDEGRVGLDEPVVLHLPSLAAGGVIDATRKRDITVRHLLSHTAGLPATLDCPATSSTGGGGDPGAPAVPPDGAAGSPADHLADRSWGVHPCDVAIDAAALVDRPGDRFVVSDAGYHVLARLVEVVTGESWPVAVAKRLTIPLGMASTSVAPAGVGATDDLGAVTPLGSSALSSGGDLGRFVAMVLHGGVGADGTRIVSADLLVEMERDQTTKLDTHLEPWVAWTGTPTFGLGVWRDRLRGDGTGAAVSAAGRWGTYCWIDRPRNAWGVLVMDDRVSPQGEAVRFSAALVQGQVPPAIETEGRAVYRAPSGGEVGGDDGSAVVVTDDPGSG